MDNQLELTKNKTSELQKMEQKQEVKLDNFGFQQSVLKQNAQRRAFSTKEIDINRIEDDEMKTMIGNVPQPDFDILTPAEEKSLKKHHAFRYLRYKKKKQAFIDKVGVWKQKDDLRRKAYSKLLKIRRSGENFPEVEPNADSMMEAYYWANEEENKQKITEFGQEETKAFLKMAKYSGFEDAKEGLTEYAAQYYVAYNDYLRKDRNIDKMENRNKSVMTADRLQHLEHADNALKLNKMSHQLVTHRYVKADALPFMLNTESQEDAEAVLQQFMQKKNKQYILQEKGFYSTGMYSTYMNEKFKSDIEIFILVEKGTRAVSVADTKLQMAKEAELLLAPGTKFELVDVRKNSAYKRKGDVKWRLFLKTIPQSSDGIPA